MAASGPHQTLLPRERDRLYLEVDGHRCPTREPKVGPEEQGSREAKAGVAFSGHAGAEVRKERHEIRHTSLQAKSTDTETGRPIFAEVYRPAGGARAAEVVVLADGARRIWSLVEDLLAHAVQILDFSQAKHYLWEAGKLIDGTGSAFVAPWGKAQEALRLEDKVEQVHLHLERFLDLAPALATMLPYFQPNASRMRYGTYRHRGYFIGSGAIESAGKHLSAARIKGPGMRWNVTALNSLLTLRCLFLDPSWQTYWPSQAPLAA